MTSKAAVAVPASMPARLPHIDAQRCTGCGRCVGVCAPHLLSLEVQHWRKFSVLHDPPACTGCSECAVVCPFGAIRMVRRPAPGATGSS